MEPSPSAVKESFDVLVVGAGHRLGLRHRGAARRTEHCSGRQGLPLQLPLHYPSNMTFFTTPELLEIGDMPFSSPNQKPSRNEALEYYRKVAEHYQLEMRLYQTVSSLTGEDGDFVITTVDRFARQRVYAARKVILATGYYDLPNYLEVPGEELPKVLHYYHDPHPLLRSACGGDRRQEFGGDRGPGPVAPRRTRDVGDRGAAMHHHVKYWILPDINNRIKNGEVTAYFSSSVTSIAKDSVELLTPKGLVTLDNDFVFALTGYHPDFDFLAAVGVQMEGKDRCPACDPQSLESNIPGLPRRSDRCRHAHQRDFHRERPFPWPSDCPGYRGQACRPNLRQGRLSLLLLPLV